MPNHVMNQLRLSGNQKRIPRFPLYYEKYIEVFGGRGLDSFRETAEE